MAENLIPFRWPEGWSDANLLAETPFNCLLVEGTQSGAPVLSGIRVLTAPPAEVHLLEGVAPGTRASRKGDGSADSGPTGKPWIDANGWQIELARALHPGKTIWVEHEAGRDLLLSVADAAAYGGRWVVTLPRTVRDGIENGEGAAESAWKALTAAVRFFTRHSGWESFEPVASVGLLSDFGKDVAFLAGEFLNLAARRPLPVRILTADSMAGLPCIVHMDEHPPDAARRDALLGFAEAGGLVISSGALTSLPYRGPAPGYAFARVGKGRVVRPVEPWSDPYQLAADVHLLVTREQDVIRLYNGASLNVRYLQDRTGTRGVVHLLNFAGTPGAHPVTVALARRWKRARLLGFDRAESAAIEPVRYGIEIPLPDFSTYLAIELEA